MGQEPLINLEVIQTNTKNWQFTITQGPKGSQTPLDLTGYELFFTVKTNPTDSDDQAVISKNITLPSNSQTSNGIAFVQLSSSDTSIPLGEYYYDIKIQLTNSGDVIVDRRTIGTGKFVVNLTFTTRTS